MGRDGSPATARHALAIGAALLLVFAGARTGGASTGGTHGEQSPAGQQEMNWPENELETRVVGELACTCGRDLCNREPLATCTCPFARKMRGEVKAALAAQSRSTAPGATAAHERVVASMQETYGDEVLIAHEPDSGGPAWLPLSVFAGGFGMLLWVSHRRMRRAARKTGDDRS